MNSDMFSDKFYWHDCFFFFVQCDSLCIFTESKHASVKIQIYTHCTKCIVQKACKTLIWQSRYRVHWHWNKSHLIIKMLLNLFLRRPHIRATNTPKMIKTSVKGGLGNKTPFNDIIQLQVGIWMYSILMWKIAGKGEH